MERVDLEVLDRDALIGKAEEAGVSRARILTRPELIDELLLRSVRASDATTLQRARGFFGRARDLLARVVERGLHLPDAADRIRAVRPSAPPPARSAAALPTVTLAEIYATQGHRDRAVETLRRVIDREPDHAAARALLVQLEDAGYVSPSPRLPPEEDGAPAGSSSEARGEAGGAREPIGMLDDEPLPNKYDVDECVAIPVDPTTLFVYWEVRDSTLAHMRKTRDGGTIALRLLVVQPTWDGPRTSVRDQDVFGQLGDFFVRDLPTGTVVRAAIGWRVGDVFVPIAQSPALETPPGEPCSILADVLVRWTPHGAQVVSSEDVDAQPIARALGIARARWSRVAVNGKGADAALGASERLAREHAPTSSSLSGRV